MARFLGLPERVTSATPTTDTYSLAQGQDEFYFALPYAQMDLALWALNHDRPVGELAAALGVTQAQAQAVHDDIRAKRRTTRSEEHTSELQSLMRLPYAVFCLKNKHTTHTPRPLISHTIC